MPDCSKIKDLIFHTKATQSYHRQNLRTVSCQALCSLDAMENGFSYHMCHLQHWTWRHLFLSCKSLTVSHSEREVGEVLA